MSVSGHSYQSRRSRNSRNSKISGKSTLSNLHHQNQLLRKDIEDIQNGLISDPFEIIDEGEEREVSQGSVDTKSGVQTLDLTKRRSIETGLNAIFSSNLLLLDKTKNSRKGRKNYFSINYLRNGLPISNYVLVPLDR